MPCRCHLRHRVALQRPTRTPTTEGFAETWDSYASSVAAAVEPATPSRVERQVAATVQTPISHIVTIRYRSGVLAKDRVLFGTRPLYIMGMQNPEERNRWLVLACEERAA